MPKLISKLKDAADIEAGTLASGMSCETPTEETHVTNKKYVDSAISEAIGAALGGSY